MVSDASTRRTTRRTHSLAFMCSPNANETDAGNLVRVGNNIEVYDHDASEYRDVSVESIRDLGGTVELEVHDYDAGEYRTLEMDD